MGATTKPAPAEILTPRNPDEPNGSGNGFFHAENYIYSKDFELKEEDFGKTVFLEKLQVISPYEGIIELPETCEIAVRRKEGAAYLFVLNYKKTPAELTLRTEGTDLYTGSRVSGKVTLDGYGTMVIKL